MSAERKRLAYALLLSLLIHTALLSLILGGEGLWLPRFGFPWQDRKSMASDLRAEIIPGQIAAMEPAVTLVAQPLPQPRDEQPVIDGPTRAPSVRGAPTPRPTGTAILPQATPTA